MKTIFRLAFLLFFIFLGCKNKEKFAQTDNLFKFKDYVAYNTHGMKSIMTDIRVGLVKPLDFEENQEIEKQKFLEISPKIKGNLTFGSGNALIFQPSEPLKPDIEYVVTVRLDRLYENVPKEFKTYTFSFHTLKPNFKVTLGDLQSYSKEWQYLEASLETSDLISLEKAKQLVSVLQQNKNLSLKWPEETGDGRFFNFRIDSIQRKKENSEILIKWDGKPIASENKGEETFKIPGQDQFKVIKLSTSLAPQAILRINFSDPLMANQNFAGLVSIENMQNLRYEVEGNVLNVYPSGNTVGQVAVTVFSGLRNAEGKKLERDFTEFVSFEPLKPEVRMISKGVILPNSDATPVYFEAVNLSKVDVRVIQIFENNVLQFLQNYNLNDNQVYDIRRVGRRIAKTTIDLENSEFTSNGNWKAYAVDLSKYFKASPGAIYQLEFSFKKEYALYDCSGIQETEEDAEEDYGYSGDPYYDPDMSEDEEIREQRYWDNEIYRWRNYVYNWEERDNPCHPAYYNEDRIITANIIGSDLGFIVKKGNNRNFKFFTSNLVSAKPESGVTVKLYDYQQQLIETLTTDKTGAANFSSEKNPAFAVAQKGNSFSYLKLENGNALSMSNFDVSGKELQRGLKGFIYTERGVYRPGDSIHLTFVLNDLSNPLPKNHPITLTVTDARGRMTERSVLNKEVDVSNARNNFYYFPIATHDTDPTGNWNAQITVGGAEFNKTLRIASIKPNRLKINLDFDDEILDVSKPIKGTASVAWLHGSPARNLKMDMQVTLRASTSAFSKFSQYNFIDPVRTFDEIEIPVMEGNLSSEGKINFNKKLEAGTTAPGMLNAMFLTKVYEGGGDFSMDVATKELAPFTHFVGLKFPKTREYDSYYTDEDNTFEIQTVDAKGIAAGNRNVKVQVFKIEWRWWWNRGNDNLSKYETSTVHRPIQEFNMVTDGKGKGSFNINIPEEEGGRFLIRVTDVQSNHATGLVTYFYRNWWQRPSDMDSESAKMLVFSADKEKYNIGEKATISFPSGADGMALISIENGSEVLETQWVQTQKGETKATIPIKKEMAPNIYVSISLLQPHNQTGNNLPMRLYGVIPLSVEDPGTVLHPKIEMPNTLKPEEKFTVRVFEENKKPMTYTLAIVDEGLLDLTRFKTPEIHKEFYSREALGVKTFDMYDFVIGAYSGSVENIYTIGGGDEALAAKNRKADRFKPVVKFLGPFDLKAGQTATHELLMDNYIGSVRVMVVAGDNTKGAYGHAEKTVPVKKPLMVLASLPRKLSPGETVTLPVTVFAMENKIKNVAVSVKTGNGLRPVNGASKNISFTNTGEQIVNFEFEVLPTQNIQTIEVTASGNGEKASYEVEIDVENPNPISRKSTDYVLEANAKEEIVFETFGIPGSNQAIIEFSTLPRMDFTKRMQFLIHYPFGCLEQVTSTGFPQLYLADVFDISFDQKQQMEKNIQATIKRLGNYQLPGGGLSYWPGEREPDEWSSSYAGHFMLEAQKKGFALPIGFINNWLQYQQHTARQWRNSDRQYNSTLIQAYRLYTLALAGKPELAAMNRLRESKDISNDAKWRLAAAYALAGKNDVAKQIAQTANIDFVPQRNDYYTYGSPFRNQAMALETMVLLDDAQQRDLSVSIARDLSSDQWLSTQETSYALLAMAKMVEKSGGKAVNVSYAQNGKTENINTPRAVAQRELSFSMGRNSVSVSNNQGNVVYVTLTQIGKLPLGEELEEQRGLNLRTSFVDAADKVVDIQTLRQGTEIIAKVSVTNTTSNDIKNVALTQIFPSGWEIVNTSFTDIGGGASGNARYTDIRDDRVNFFFDLNKGENRIFTVKLNASYLGKYYLPGAQVEGMYDHSYFARNKGKWVEVVE